MVHYRRFLTAARIAGEIFACYAVVHREGGSNPRPLLRSQWPSDKQYANATEPCRKIAELNLRGKSERLFRVAAPSSHGATRRRKKEKEDYDHSTTRLGTPWRHRVRTWYASILYGCINNSRTLEDVSAGRV